MSILGGLGGCLGGSDFGAIGGGFGTGLQNQLQATDRAMLAARAAYETNPLYSGITFVKSEPDGLREELQAETDEWLKEAVK